MIKSSRLIVSIILFFALFVNAGCLLAQTPPFYNEIQAFKKQDSLQKPPANPIVFTGSSSFRLWKNVQEEFPGYNVINRAFGGSTIKDVARYANDIVMPYNPRQVVIYCGDNDLAKSDSVKPEIVAMSFIALFTGLRYKMPNTSIVYVSIKPSPSRQHLMTKMEEVNRQIENFLKKQKNTAFVDVYHKMLNPDGTPMKDLFLEDNLHMNDKGYSIWKAALQPYLIK